MNRTHARVILVVALLTGIAAFSFGEYDQEKVVGVMRANLALMGEIGKAMEAEDWHAAASSFWDIAEMALGILPFTPPRGTKADWDKTMTELVFAAYQGVGAAGNKDIEAMQEAYGKLRQLNRQGHGAHKPR